MLLVGFNIIGIWKILFSQGMHDSSVAHSVDVLAQEMLNFVDLIEQKASEATAHLVSSDLVTITEQNGLLSNLSSHLIFKQINPHTKVFLKHKQVR